MYLITFEFNEVLAALNKEFLSDKFMDIDISVRNSVALLAARWKDSAIVVGCIPRIGQK